MSGERILVVDDDPDVREVLCEDLEHVGYQVRQARSGQHALEILGAEKFDLVLSDVRMPNGDGLFLLEKLRARHPTEPRVVLITGYAEPSAADLQRMGAQGLLPKPYDVAELHRIIREQLS